MLQKIRELLSSVIEHQKYKRFLGEDSRPSYFPHKSLTCWRNGKEGKIGASEAPQKRLTVFVSGWVNKSLSELRASRLKLFWGTPPSSRTQNRVCLAFLQFSNPTTPLFCHLYAGKKSFAPPSPPRQTPVAFVTSLYVQF
jgi:hypothetical protein